MEKASHQPSFPSGHVFWRTWGILLLLLGVCGLSQASIYHKAGICTYKEQYFTPGQTFYKACDKCYCHQFGFFCYPPKKPTSWPRKCMRVPSDCGYRVVYRKDPEVECRAYSFIG